MMRDMLRTLRLDTLNYQTPDYKNKITYNEDPEEEKGDENYYNNDDDDDDDTHI
jgi:hypothetical protein